MSWRPWRVRVEAAERRLAEAEERTRQSAEVIRKSRKADAELRRVVGRNGFGEAFLLAMERRKA